MLPVVTDAAVKSTVLGEHTAVGLVIANTGVVLKLTVIMSLLAAQPEGVA